MLWHALGYSVIPFSNFVSSNMLTSAICTHFLTVFAVFINLYQRFLSELVNSDILYFSSENGLLLFTLIQERPSSVSFAFSNFRPTFLNLLFWIRSSFRDSPFIGCLSLAAVPFMTGISTPSMSYSRHGALFKIWYPYWA